MVLDLLTHDRELPDDQRRVQDVLCWHRRKPRFPCTRLPKGYWSDGWHSFWIFSRWRSNHKSAKPHSPWPCIEFKFTCLRHFWIFRVETGNLSLCWITGKDNRQVFELQTNRKEAFTPLIQCYFGHIFKHWRGNSLDNNSLKYLT